MNAVLVRHQSPRYHRLLACIARAESPVDDVHVTTRAIAESTGLRPCGLCRSEHLDYEVPPTPARWELQ